MAISRMLTTGFEIDYRASTFSSSRRAFENQEMGDQYGGTDTSHSRTGNQALKLFYTTEASFPLSAAKTQLQVSYLFKERVSVHNPATNAVFVAFSDDKVSNYLGATLQVSGQDIVAKTNNVVRDTWTNGMASIRVGRYHHVAIDIKFHTTTGWFYVWFDGVEVINYSGQTDHLISDASVVWLNGYFGSTTWPFTQTQRYIDDLYINDSEGEGAAAMPDAVALHYVRPNGNGNYTAWTGSDGDTTDNYLHLDEASGTLPDESTSCIETAVATNKDSWTVENPTLPADITIDAVIPSIIAQNGGAGQDSLKVFTRYSATDSLSAAVTTPLVWGMIQDYQTTKPGGGAWDLTAVNGMEVGVEMQ